MLGRALIISDDGTRETYSRSAPDSALSWYVQVRANFSHGDRRRRPARGGRSIAARRFWPSVRSNHPGPVPCEGGQWRLPLSLVPAGRDRGRKKSEDRSSSAS